MTELKTLKDLKGTLTVENRDDVYERIKQEAIKWVKEIGQLENRKDFIQIMKGMWINFFNITKEDLK